MPDNQNNTSVFTLTQTEWSPEVWNTLEQLMKKPNSIKKEEDIIKDYKGDNFKRGDCIFLESIQRYASKDDPDLTDDYFTGEKELKRYCIKLYSIIKDNNVDTENGIFYTLSKYKEFYSLYHTTNGVDYIFTDSNILLNNNKIYVPDLNLFVDNIDLLKKLKKSSELTYKKFNNIVHDYELDDRFPLKYGKKSPTYLITEGKKYTFGVEIETILGRVPSYLIKELNVDCVYDGSLKNENGDVTGGEYTTGVLTGDTGFKHLKFICDTLAENCKINKKCGVHVHLGNIIFDKITLYFIYKLAYTLQGEIYSILPQSRRNNEYCRSLPHLYSFNDDIKTNSNFMFELDVWYNEFMYFISKKSNSNKVNKKNNHPQGSKCNYDHSTARYCWLNFVPAVFDTRGNGVYSIEFRPHSATLSYYKIKNWILLCMAIINVAENNKTEIIECKNITLEWLLKLAYPKNYSKLMRYINDRKVTFLSDSNLNAENAEHNEYKTDKIIKNKSFKELIEE